MTTFNTFNVAVSDKISTAIPTSAQSQRGGAFSVNIVCAKNNRKSITLTKKLADALQLTTDVYVTVYANDGSIALSQTPIDENSAQYSFSNDSNHIVYNANLVRFIAETFALDYTKKTSMSFKNIKFGSANGVAYAEVILTQKTTSPPCTVEIEPEEEVSTDDENL